MATYACMHFPHLYGVSIRCVSVCVFSTLVISRQYAPPYSAYNDRSGLPRTVLVRDLTRHPDRPTTTVSASPVLGFIGLNKGVGSCIPSYGPGGVGGGRGG